MLYEDNSAPPHDMNKYCANILVGYENKVPEVESQKFIGLDFSMHDLYVTSDG